MFDGIASTYDKVNRWITFGSDVYWRNKLVQKISLTASSLIDVASGTMDVAITAVKNCPQLKHVIALDMAKEMLDIGEKKCEAMGISKIVKQVADVHQLPFNDNAHDAITVSFGIRNFESLPTAFKEMHRVLKPKGDLIILESCQPKNRLLRFLNNVYLRFWVIPIGSFFSGERSAYSYLMESIEAFSSPEELKQALLSAGFKKVEIEFVMFQSVQIIHAIK